jgi:hypothetical protein
MNVVHETRNKNQPVPWGKQSIRTPEVVCTEQKWNCKELDETKAEKLKDP